MKFKKLASLFLVLSMVSIAIIGCSNDKNDDDSSKTKQEEQVDQEDSKLAEVGDFTITIEGDSTIELKKVDLDKVGTKEVDATIKKKDKDPETNKWIGYVLKDVLEANGITEYKSLTIEAADGFGNEYTKDIVDSGLLIGVLMDGKILEEGTSPMLVVDGEGGNMWIKGMSKIIVNK